MKKICFFIQDAYTGGGIERVVSIIAHELSDEYDVTILSLFHSIEKPFHIKFDYLKIVNVLDFGPHLSYKRNFFKLKNKVTKKLKEINPDILIVCGMRIYGLAPVVVKKQKTIVWEHSSSFAKNVGSRHGHAFGRLASKFFADEVVVLTERDRENYVNKLKFSSSKVHQIYNPIDLEPVNGDYDLSSKKIITVGRFCIDKGYDLLVEVAKKVYEKHPDWEWHIWGAGNNDTEKTIASLIHEESLDDFLKIKGVTNDIYNKYKEYSFFVMTSRNEGFGMVIVEAQRAKLPVIAFNCECGPNELILNDKNGFLIDCFDIDKMAYKINYLIEHPEVRKTMSDNSMLDKEKLKLSLICDKWKNVIEE